MKKRDYTSCVAKAKALISCVVTAKRRFSCDTAQILSEASLGKGCEILFKASGSHEQDGRHAHL